MDTVPRRPEVFFVPVENPSHEVGLVPLLTKALGERQKMKYISPHWRKCKDAKANKLNAMQSTIP